MRQKPFLDKYMSNSGLRRILLSTFPTLLLRTYSVLRCSTLCLRAKRQTQHLLHTWPPFHGNECHFSHLILKSVCLYKAKHILYHGSRVFFPQMLLLNQGYKGPYSQGYGLPSGHVWFESWTVQKAECQRTDAFKLWCWRRLLKVPWTARRSNQSILREINPECSL